MEDMTFVINEKVFILTKYDVDEHDTDNNILGVFRTKENAIQYKYEYIREFYSVDDDILDEDLEQELGLEFNVETYWVNP
jgi:hypothetical protein